MSCLRPPRLLLDAHASGKRVAAHLREQGYDAYSVSERPELDGIDDDEALTRAASENRVVVSFDAKDSLPILRDWMASGRSHRECHR